MFESLQDRLEGAFKNLKGEGRITDLNIASTIKEIRRALVDADVNYKIAKEFTDTVREQAQGEKVINAISPGQLMVKIVKDELVRLMGGDVAELNAKGAPAVILIAGLQGSGKTTFSGKLANYLKTQRKLSPLLVAADVYRPAAMEQLRVLGEQIGVDVHIEAENKNPVEIAQNAIREARSKNKNVVIIDTAGRLAIDEAMMTEVANIKGAVSPNEILFVVDSMTGQDAVNTAKAFNDRLDFSGVVLTKLDGDTRGGAALSIKYTVNKPIKFISSGEKLDTLDVFYPERMAQRILGMGDITTLVEKAQAQFDEEEAKRLEKKIRKNQFDFDDFKTQLEQIKRMGNLKDLLGMIPGVGKAIKDINISDDAFKGIEAIIGSMTPAERGNPDLIDGSRRKRIAKGSGKDISDVNNFMKQFEQMRELMKMMNKMPMGKMMPGGFGKR
ncbi:signal recognition particle protein [Flaviaesturariibacter aridisoli]|uniref:Signal recognition particle protein n=1 Tax=Flaviaesturariibacter aridisoli TaxID=2545761 RepID=A0A4R4E7S5_9BACT|nr:signal recognition particle protein [Flaviaesturariibacter aridisoli]RYY64876.1 MAG: signal recognition particle protein [Chitinophagaceae bacterium]TCZ74983.1 signal recognition particle protein [Flaviaesturariibacter aridisoli]